MKRFVKKAAAAIMVLTMVVGMMAGCSTSKDLKTQNGDKVLFTYDGVDTTLKEAWIYAKMTKAQYDAYYGTYYGADFWTTPMGVDDDGKPVLFETYVKQQVVDQIKQIIVLNNKAEEYKVSLTDDEKKQCAEYAKKFAESEEGAAILKECGASESDMAAIYEKNAIASKVQKEAVKDVDSNVTDDEARKTTISRIVYKTTNTASDGGTEDMTDAEKAKVLKKAQATLKKIQAGTTLADVAKEEEYSNTTETFSAGESEEGKVLEDKLAKMKDGDLIPEVMECSNGYVIAQLTAYTDKTATDSNKETIVAERQQSAFKTTYAEWTKELDKDWSYDKNVDKALWDEVVLHTEESTEATTAIDSTATEAATEAPAEATTQAK